MKSLNEGVSSVLYHSTNIHNLRDIVVGNTIRLTPDIGTSSEEEQRKGSKIFYLSTARSKTGSYAYPVSKHKSQGSMIVLDGQALMADGYTGDAVSYWGPDFRASGKDEMEDRIFSEKPSIPNASKYIKEIHVLMSDPPESADYRRHGRTVKNLLLRATHLGIDSYWYNDNQAFALLNKNRSLPIKQLTSPVHRPALPGRSDGDDPLFTSGKRRSSFSDWMELLYVDDYEKLTRRAKDQERRATSMDGDRILANDIHNSRTGVQRPALDKFIAAMKQFKLRSTADVIKHIAAKF